MRLIAQLPSSRLPKSFCTNPSGSLAKGSTDTDRCRFLYEKALRFARHQVLPRDSNSASHPAPHQATKRHAFALKRHGVGAEPMWETPEPLLELNSLQKSPWPFPSERICLLDSISRLQPDTSPDAEPQGSAEGVSDLHCCDPRLQQGMGVLGTGPPPPPIPPPCPPGIPPLPIYFRDSAHRTLGKRCWTSRELTMEPCKHCEITTAALYRDGSEWVTHEGWVGRRGVPLKKTFRCACTPVRKWPLQGKIWRGAKRIEASNPENSCWNRFMCWSP